MSGLIAKIHVARKQLALTDESYRDVLRRITGRESCALMNEGQLESVLAEFKRLGFAPTKTSRRSGGRKLAQGRQAKMIRGLWIELHQLGAVRDPSEEALAAYATRMAGVSDLHWITPADANSIIKGLRGWLERVQKEAIHDAS